MNASIIALAVAFSVIVSGCQDGASRAPRPGRIPEEGPPAPRPKQARNGRKGKKAHRPPRPHTLGRTKKRRKRRRYRIPWRRAARKKRRRKPLPLVDMGEARFPAGNTAKPTEHTWKTWRRRRARYRLGYGVDDKTARGIRRRYHGYARTLHHKRLPGGRHRWRPPRGCVGGLHCIYRRLAWRDRSAVKPIAELFRAQVKASGFSAYDAAAAVVGFIQHITYRIPKKEPFGILPPALVARERWGDCDSKALLAHMVLRELGIDSVLITSRIHRHTMLGVAIPAPLASFTWHGRRYAFVETTAKGAPIGHINPKLRSPNDWRVEPLPYDRWKRRNKSIVAFTGQTSAVKGTAGRTQRRRRGRRIQFR